MKDHFPLRLYIEQTENTFYFQMDTNEYFIYKYRNTLTNVTQLLRS